MTREKAIEILKSEQVVALGTIDNITTTDVKRAFARLKHDALGAAISALKEPERKHGEWTDAFTEAAPNPMYVYGECSECGFMQNLSKRLSFCPNCGAIMDGKEK